jgi:ABC-type multidrug transport system fused ATPase/permease subunit
MTTNKFVLKNLMIDLWKHVSPKRKRELFVLIILIFLSSLAEVISLGAVIPFLGVLTNPERVYNSQFIKPFLEYLNINNAKGLLFPLTILFSTTILLSALMRFVALWVQTKLSFGIGADISISIYKKTLFQPYAVHVARNSSEIISSISSKVNTVISYVIMPFVTIINSIFMIVMIIGFLFYINPLIATIAFSGFGVIYGIIILLSKKRLAIHSERVSYESNQVIKSLQEGLGGIRDVLIDGTQSIFCEVYQKADLPLRKAQAGITIIGSSPRFGIEALSVVLISFLALNLAKGGLEASIPLLGSLVLGSQRLLPIMQQGYVSWSSLHGSISSLNDILLLLNQPMPENIIKDTKIPLHFKNTISLKNVSFSYGENLPLTLNNISIDIKKGSMIGFVGTTGSGKSTILDIIMGLLIPTKGKIEIDDVQITENNFRNWQSNIAHVPQSIFLSDSTILENIAFGVPKSKINLEHVIRAAKMAQIHNTIIELNEGYSTLVGERGVRLSGGQRQRIGIARALYKQANVIILDEATSALDNSTEQDVMTSIERLENNLTIVIVAHRISTLKNCQKIIELSNGEIIFDGSYEEFINKK